MKWPAGVSFYIGEAARLRRRLEEKLAAVLEDSGFEEVITPVFEYYDPKIERVDAEDVYRFPDQLTGRMMALRWDFTLQVARLAAERLKSQEGIHRWYYRGSVFRPVREHAGQKRQIFQIGAEVFGDPSPDCTTWMIDLAVTLLRASGIDDFSIVISHVGLIKKIISLASLPEESQVPFREILERKDLSGLKRMAGDLGLSEEKIETVRRAMYLIGNGDVLDKAGEMLGDDHILEDLKEISRKVGAGDRIIFDLTEPRGFDYYTGIMFQAIVPKIGREVLKGGRYNNLLGRFGWTAPAVGFALDLDLVVQAFEDR